MKEILNIHIVSRRSQLVNQKILLAIPCLRIILAISFQARESFGEVDKIKNEFDKIKNDLARDFFSPNYILASQNIRTNILNDHMAVYALS